MEQLKVFISYSWSNAIHENWVIDLATELRNSGVDWTRRIKYPVSAGAN